MDDDEGIFWDAFDYIYKLVFGSGSSSDDSIKSDIFAIDDQPSTSTNIIQMDTDNTISSDTCNSAFTKIEPVVMDTYSKTEYVINITINDSNKPLKLRLPETLQLAPDDTSFIGLIALSNNELINVPEFNENNQTEISMTQYYRAVSNKNCVIIHLTTIINKNKTKCECYICVDYDMSKNIIKTDAKDLNAGTFNFKIFTNWEKLNESSQCNGVVPNPNGRSTKDAYKYLFNTTKYADELRTIITNKNSNKASVISNQIPGSVYSPVDTIITEMGMSLRMDDIMKHGVNGLGEVAEKRYSDTDDKIKSLQTLNTEGSFQPINEQIKNFDKNTDLQDIIKRTCAINDFTDLAHDVRTLQYLDNYINLVFPNKDATINNNTQLKSELSGLLNKPSNNINVPKSHEIQKKNIKDLETYLRNTANIIIPNIPTEKYESRYEMYLQLIVDLMQGVKRSNYSESGKQLTIKTFKDFYNKLDKDNQILFCQNVQNRINDFNKSANSDKSVSAGSGKSESTSTGEQKITSVLQEYPTKSNYPSIPKECGLDGCETGERGSDMCEYTIQNIYGLYDFKIKGSNKTEWNITITRHGETTSILTWKGISGNFHIILDDVILYINNNIDNKPDGFSQIQYRSGKEFISKNVGEYKKIEFNTMIEVNEKILLVFSLKTAMDKLYRISGEKLTEIGTIDSYVWGDVYIQYLLGYLKNLLMIYRVSDATGDMAQNVGDCDVEIDALGGRGLVVHPMVKNLYTNEDGLLLMKKTLVYANWLQQLANMNNIQTTNESQMEGKHSVEVSVSLTDVFKLKEFFVEGKLFDTTKDKFGSLIPTDIRMSYRLLNFVERLGLNGDIKTQKSDEYDKTMVELFNTERDNVIKRVNEYIRKLQKIMDTELTDKSAICKAIVELPDLEDLLVMSSPSYYVDNEDTLIDIDMIPKPIITQSILEVDEDSMSSSFQDSLDEGSVQEAKQQEQHINLFTDVEFLDNGNINIITPSNSNLVKMAKATNNEYKSTTNGENNVITGPITLELLCKLKEYAHDNSIREKITSKINNMIETFKSTFLDVSSEAGAGAVDTKSEEEGAGSNKDDAKPADVSNAQWKAYNDGFYGKEPGKFGGDDKENLSSYYRQGIYDRENNNKIKPSLNQQVQRSAETGMLQMDTSSGSESEKDEAKQDTSSDSESEKNEAKQYTKRAKIGGGRTTRKRKLSKMPRRTIRRRAPKRGQSRTIRRRRRNKKGTQKRRK